MRAVVDAAVVRFAEHFGNDAIDRQDVAWRAPEVVASQPVKLLGRLAEAGVQAIDLARERPPWMRVKAKFDDGYLELKQLMRDNDLHTVCEEAGCPNIYECWADRTATFMILGDRCTRACGFCQIDTRKPLPVDTDEPRRVADAVATMGLAHAVITCVARDDLPDGGASIFAQTVDAIRARNPGTNVELLISDCKGDADALATIFAARPDVLNHNLETVARLQRAARPSAGYARSLAVLARAKDAGLLTKSGIILGMGETDAEVRAAIADLRAVGVDVLTIGQYLRPSPQHLPVVRWWTPEEFDALADYAGRARLRSRRGGPAGAVELPRAGGRRPAGGGGPLTQWGRGCLLRVHRAGPRRVAASPAGLLRRHRTDRSRRAREPVAQGLRHVPRARPESGRVPRPDRERGRDDRAPARERPHHAHVLRVLREPRHRSAVRKRHGPRGWYAGVRRAGAAVRSAPRHPGDHRRRRDRASRRHVGTRCR